MAMYQRGKCLLTQVVAMARDAYVLFWYCYVLSFGIVTGMGQFWLVVVLVVELISPVVFHDMDLSLDLFWWLTIFSEDKHIQLTFFTKP